MRALRLLASATLLLAGCGGDVGGAPPSGQGGATVYDGNGAIHDRIATSAPKIDILFMIDNSASMADKQTILARAIPDLVGRLVTPSCGGFDMNGKFFPSANQPGADPIDPARLLPCAAGEERELATILDIHIGVVSSSLGDHGSDTCHFTAANGATSGNNPTLNDGAHLLQRSPRPSPTVYTFNQPKVPTYGDEGFLAWDPTGKKNNPPGENVLGDPSSDTGLEGHFAQIVAGADQAGCGYEAQMEAWYRFLIEPNPPTGVDHVRGASGKVDFEDPNVAASADTDQTILQQRADFLRPDSLVAIISLSDENDGSVIDGPLPAKVCNKPTRDKAGALTGGCDEDLKDWPAGYATSLNMNFNGGQPFPANWLVAQLAIPENVPYTLPPGINYYHMLPGTTPCDGDWASPDCKSCLNGEVQGDTKCAKAFAAATAPTDDDDPILLRLWETKRRFGVDFLYPLQRYIDGIKNTYVYDRNGFLVPNPLFDDLKYNAMIESGGKPTRPHAVQRPANLVFYAAIAGVPWQDLARDPKNLAAGYKPAFSTDPNDPGLNDPVMVGGQPLMGPDGAVTGWDLILGDPFNPNTSVPDGSKGDWGAFGGSKRRDPVDPLMRESNRPRFGNGQPALTHPITGEALGDSWNSINGNDYVASKLAVPGSSAQDLEYACIFPLPADLPPADCKAAAMAQLPCDCSNWDPVKSKNPLCATPVGDDRAVGKYGDYNSSLLQYRAKAYPGTRYLHVLKGIEKQAIVASICAANTNDPAGADYGYRPAVAAIIERLKTQLGPRCLPIGLPTGQDGTVSCAIIDAKMPRPTSAAEPDPFSKADIDACSKCDGPAREPLDTPAQPVVATTLVGDVTDYRCLCAVSQYGQKGTATDLANLTACTTAPDPLSLDAGGWCYVDPATAPPQKQAAEAALVARCPSTQQRKIRFVNADTDDINLFIVCGAGAVGSAGAAGK